MAEEIPRLLNLLEPADASHLTPETVIPANTCIQGKAKGITQQGKGLYITSMAADYYLIVDEVAMDDFSKALRAISMAVDVSGGKVVKREAKLKGAVQVTEIEIRLQGEVKAELLTRERKRVHKVYLRKGSTRKNATKAAVTKGSPPPTSNSWAHSSPDLPVQPLTKAKKLTERPLHTAIAPTKRKASLGMTDDRSPGPAGQAPLKPLSAFRGIDQDLMVPAKKRKTSVESEKSRDLSVSSVAEPDPKKQDPQVAMEVDAPPVASAIAGEETIMFASSASKVPAPPAPAAQPTLPKSSPQAPLLTASPPAVRQGNGGVNIINGPEAASSSRIVPRPTASTNRQQMREKMEARALAKRAAEQAEEAEKLKEAASDIATLEEGITVGMKKYTPLKDVANSLSHNIIAVVADLREAKQGSSIAQTFFAADPGINKNAGNGDEMLITVFCKSRNETPARQVGDVILLRGVKGQMWAGRVKLLGPGGQWSWAAMDKNDGKIKLGPHVSQLHPDEIKHMRHMLAWSKVTGLGGSTPGVAPVDATIGDRPVGSSKRPQLLLKDVKPDVFFDSVAQVIHFNQLPPRQGASEAELILTDGTSSSVYPPYIFSSVQHQLPPSAVFSVIIWKTPEVRIQSLFKPGAFVRITNIRAKLYGDRLECVDHDSNVESQAGFRKKDRYIFVDPKSEEAKAIVARRAALEKGEVVQDRAPNGVQQVPVDDVEMAVPPVKSQALAGHLRTIHSDQPLSTLADIKQNLTFPNKYRVQARVPCIYPRNNPKALIIKYCKKCRKRFKNTHCEMCGDDALINAEFRYEIMIELAQDGSDAVVCALISHDEALKFLPVLPRFTADANHNAGRVAHAGGCKVQDALFGAASDGKRPHPIIDFTLQSYTSEGYAVLQVFGMSSK